MLISLAQNDFKAKYAGSALGMVWAFVTPVITILIYWFVFQVAFKNGPVGDVPYVLWLVSGIVPWFFMSEGWGGATGVLIDYSYLVKKVVFPVELLPGVRVTSAFFVHLFFVLLTFVVNFCCLRPPAFIHLQIFYYMAAAYILTLALGRVTSILTAFTRDTSNLVGVIVQLGFWITPLFWDINSLPKGLQTVFHFNPFFYVTEGYRATFVYGVPFWVNWWQGLYFWGITALLIMLGNLLYKRLRPHLADML